MNDSKGTGTSIDNVSMDRKVKALRYLEQVQTTIEPEQFSRFEALMSSFTTKQIDAADLIAQIHVLFADHPQLIANFDDFLPPHDRLSTASSVTASARSSKRSRSIRVKKRKSKTSLIESGSSVPTTTSTDNTTTPITPSHKNTIPEQPKESTMPSSETSVGEHFSNAVVFVNTVKRTFSDTPEVYFEFLNILRAYQRESRSPLQIYERVSQLFEGHPELLEGFKQFVKLEQQGDEHGMGLPKSESNETLSGVAATASSHKDIHDDSRNDDERQPLLGRNARDEEQQQHHYTDLESSAIQLAHEQSVRTVSRSAYITAIVFAVLGWLLLGISVLVFIFRSSLPIVQDW